MIDNQGMRVLLKIGSTEGLEGNTNATNYFYVGGSPIALSSGGYVTGEVGANGQGNYIGMAYHPWSRLTTQNPIQTMVLGDAFVTLVKGDDEIIPPWEPGLTYTVGEALRPIEYTEPTTGKIYSVWTNRAYTGSATTPYRARIMKIDNGTVQSSSSPTYITIVKNEF